jgi:CheY-like chemotaxis protein/nitrogen-specific signal transduction histidine kinase
MSMRRVKRAKSATRRRKVAPARGSAAPADATEIALASFAHEIRTPLNGILALSELIAAADLPAREREWASQIKSAAEHLAAFATLIVDGARAHKRGLTLRETPFHLRTLAEGVGAALSARAEAKGLACDLTIAIDLPDRLVGDGVRLRAALENLADNAVKFTERGRVAMTIGAAPGPRKSHRVVFSFTDSGIGLTRQEIAQLFRPFAQANAGVARRFGGAGLGLVFVRRLARAMGGDLTVESTPGRGSTFRLAVTIKPAPDTPYPATRGIAKSGSPKGLRVLCADDNPFARAVLKTVLTELGHRVDFAADGKATVGAVASGDYDLVLMDLTLPGMDGSAATRAIRALNGPAARIPIIGVSCRTEPHEIEAARAAGMDAFLAKPVSPALLAQTLAELRGVGNAPAL